MRMTLEEMLQDVKERLTRKYWNMRFEPHDWFFPSSLSNSGKFKYRCNKLYMAGLLEREGDGANRWGYRYRVPDTK